MEDIWLLEALCRQRHEQWLTVDYIMLCVDRGIVVWIRDGYEILCAGRDKNCT